MGRWQCSFDLFNQPVAPVAGCCASRRKSGCAFELRQFADRVAAVFGQDVMLVVLSIRIDGQRLDNVAQLSDPRPGSVLQIGCRQLGSAAFSKCPLPAHTRQPTRTRPRLGSPILKRETPTRLHAIFPLSRQ